MTGSNDAQRRTYVLRHGHFITLPEGLQLVVPTQTLPVLETELFSWDTKFRMATEMFHNPKAWPDRSVSAFVADHFGAEAVDYLAEPLLAGVYGGSPDSLSAASVLPKFVEYEQRFGSVVVGAHAREAQTGGRIDFQIAAQRNGLADRCASRQRPRSSRRAWNRFSPANGWGVFAAGEWHEFDQSCFAAAPTHAAPLIGAGRCARWRTAGRDPLYGQFDLDLRLSARGCAAPARCVRISGAQSGSGSTIMACTWVATKWLGRVPDGKAVLRCFSTDPNVSRRSRCGRICAG